MQTVHAIYENGLFRPTYPVDLPDNCRVQFVPTVVAEGVTGQAHLSKICEILSRSYETGETDLAARHDEHQP
jgi:predicted DNA-binding antitoxin AbrB/MazE fold protein